MVGHVWHTKGKKVHVIVNNLKCIDWNHGEGSAFAATKLLNFAF
jgi:hypothetical protein